MSHISRNALIGLLCVVCIFSISKLQAGVLGHEEGHYSPEQSSGNRNGNNELHSYPIVSGIGAALSITPAGPRIREVIPNSAAAHNGELHAGDLILAIDTNNRIISLKGKSLGKVVSLIRGPVGTSITLSVRSSNGKNSLVTITRESVPIPLPSYRGLLNKVVPNVPFTTLQRSSPMRLSDYKGKVVVLDLWGPWCGACYAPLDKLQLIVAKHPQWKGRVVFLAASIHASRAADLKAIRQRGWNKITFLSLSLTNLKRMQIQVVPTLLVISQSGRIAAVGDPHAVPIESIVSKLLLRTGAA